MKTFSSTLVYFAIFAALVLPPIPQHNRKARLPDGPLTKRTDLWHAIRYEA